MTFWMDVIITIIYVSIAWAVIFGLIKLYDIIIKRRLLTKYDESKNKSRKENIPIFNEDNTANPYTRANTRAANPSNTGANRTELQRTSNEISSRGGIQLPDSIAAADNEQVPGKDLHSRGGEKRHVTKRRYAGY